MRCAFAGVYDVVAREAAKRAANRGGSEVGIVERRYVVVRMTIERRDSASTDKAWECFVGQKWEDGAV